MVKALTIGISVMTGILIGRIQVIENHDANDAIAMSARSDKRAADAKRDAIRTRALLDSTERKLLGMWRRLEPMLEDFVHADNIISRDAARRRIETLHWEMSTASAVITASRELTGQDERTAMRQVFVKETMGE